MTNNRVSVIHTEPPNPSYPVWGYYPLPAPLPPSAPAGQTQVIRVKKKKKVPITPKVVREEGKETGNAEREFTPPLKESMTEELVRKYEEICKAESVEPQVSESPPHEELEDIPGVTEPPEEETESRGIDPATLRRYIVNYLDPLLFPVVIVTLLFTVLVFLLNSPITSLLTVLSVIYVGIKYHVSIEPFIFMFRTMLAKFVKKLADKVVEALTPPEKAKHVNKIYPWFIAKKKVKNKVPNFAKLRDSMQKGQKPIDLTAKFSEKIPSNLNFKVQLQIATWHPILAEIDTDSHVSLINDQYYELVKNSPCCKVTDQPKATFYGIAGGESVSPYPPVQIVFSIGQAVLKGEFIVTPALTSSPILLGNNILFAYKIGLVPTLNEWQVRIGPEGPEQIASPCIVTKKVDVTRDVLTTEVITIPPLEKVLVKKINLVNQCHSKEILTQHIELEVTSKREGVTVTNKGLTPFTLLPGVPFAKEKLPLVKKSLKQKEGPTLENDFLLEQMLEPGVPPQRIISKEKELDFIKNHAKIPNGLKKDFVEFLEKIPHLYSGEEFSKKHFPRSVFEHKIELMENSPPQLSQKPFPAHGIRLQQLKENIEDLVNCHVLSPGDSEYVSPCFYVLKKPDGTKAAKGRLCFDYRRLNSMIKPLNFPLTSVKNFFNEASKYKVFCVVDISNAFLSIPVAEESKKYLAITTPFGVFLPQRTPFGLKTSPSAFCSCMNIVLNGINFASYYMDDILIGAESEEEMIKHLKIIFKRLNDHNLKIQLSKTKFFETEIKVLGTIFSAQGKRVCPKRTQAINDFPKIKSVKMLQTFLGMLCFISSFIPNYSTACFPLFSLLKDQKNKKFEWTEEAELAYNAIKNYIKTSLMLYHPDFSKELYLAVDASNVACGSFLYQIDIFDKTPENKEALLKKFNFEPETSNSHFLLPGVSPGKNTPIVTTFTKNESDIKNFAPFDNLNSTLTMTEKIEKLKDKIIMCKPLAFYSKTFNSGQILKYSSMEKEFLSLMLSILNFRGEIEAAPLTFLLSDSQATLWALKHKNENAKLSRYLLKLFELNVNIVITHISGSKNRIADYISRIYFVEEPLKNKDSLKPRMAQHVRPTFPPLSVITKEMLLKSFKEDTVTECNAPELCHLNVNSQLFGKPGPFCYEATPVCNKILNAKNYGFVSEELDAELTNEKIKYAQNLDPKCVKVREILKTGPHPFLYIQDDIVRRKYSNEKIKYAQNLDPKCVKIREILKTGPHPFLYIQDDIVRRKYSSEKIPHNIVLPDTLVKFAIAREHLKFHCGGYKLMQILRQKYTWKDMKKDCVDFTKGCILCSIYKHSSTGKTEIGVPRVIYKPCSYWQIDICSGLPPVKGYTSFLNCVDLFSGFSVPIALSSETSERIAKAIDDNIIKIFGPPIELSMDNAANLQGKPVRDLCNFYKIKLKFTTPYSPESHGVVESSNRYIVQTVRILSDQFQKNWYEMLSLAALTNNTVPRPALSNKSPFFFTFGFEPFLEERNYNNLNMDDYINNNQNNRNFALLLREFLIRFREKRNKQVNRKYLSFPKNTLVYVKDFSKTDHKKIKPVYVKAPKRVVTEYQSVVYLEDIFGKVTKASKNNIKIANDRSVKLFNELPKDIQIILGEPMNIERWNDIKISGIVPQYLESIQIDAARERLTRSGLAKESHIIEKDQNPVNTEKGGGTLIFDDDEWDWEEILTQNTLTQLKRLHEGNHLSTPIPLHEIPKTYDSLIGNDVNELLNEVERLPRKRRTTDTGIDPKNILTSSRRPRLETIQEE